MPAKEAQEAGPAGAGNPGFRELVTNVTWGWWVGGVPGDGAQPAVRCRRVGLDHPVFRPAWGYQAFLTPEKAGPPERHLAMLLGRVGRSVVVLPPVGEALAHALLNAVSFGEGMRCRVEVVDLARGLVRFHDPDGPNAQDCYVRTARVLGA
jgi:hypothetical protein